MSENESRVANVRTQLFRITTYEPVDYMGGAQPVRPSKLRSCVTLRNIPVGTPPQLNLRPNHGLCHAIVCQAREN